jgi:hypothetical protein
MTLLASLISVGYVKVGTGEDASPSYPVLRDTRRTETVTAPGSDTVSFRERTLTLVCAAQAADLDSVAALKATLETQLCRPGARVEIGAFTGTSVFEASSVTGVGGSPTFTLELDPEASVGTWQQFTLTIVHREPITDAMDANNVALDERTTTETISELGLETTTLRGRARITPGGTYATARAYVQAEILDALITAATSAGQTNRRSFTVGLDPLECSYELVTADPSDGANPGAAVTKAELVDETRRDSSGRTTRTVSGYAEGVGSSTYAASAKPTLGSGDLLVSDRVSQPSGAAGRVNFNYEVINGTVPGGSFGSLRVFSFNESFDVAGGERELRVATYAAGEPVLYRGELSPFVYTQRTSIEFNGSWTDAESVADGSTMDADNLARAPDFRRSEPRPGVRRIDATLVYVYPTEQTTPDPRQIGALS